MDPLKTTRQRMAQYQADIIEQLNAFEVDAHWFRRVFHTFAASFLVFYLIPDGGWIGIVKIIVPIGIVACIAIIDYGRIRGELDHQRFFGLRGYEKGRPASYLYFGVALLLLLLLFPQQIAIPCILCGSFTDPLIGESRYHFGKKRAYLIGFLVSMFFFLLTWYRADWWVILTVSVVGAIGAVVGEAKKLRLVDDDFTIQILPALLLILVWQGIFLTGIDILPPPLILPL
jgi:dolichol kinase